MAALIIFLVIGFGVDTVSTAPSNIKVLLDHKYETYIAPMCLNPNVDYASDEFEMSSYIVAEDGFEYKADSRCTEEELSPTRSLIGVFLLEKIGIVKPISTRWHEDGSWNEEYIKKG